MTWPTTQTTNSLDADSDTLQNARPEVKGLADKFNQLVAHVTAFMQGLLSSADAATARTTLDVPSRNGAGASGAWGISVTGSAATATTATNVTRSVTGAGLATGGGALTADQAINVPKASQAQAEAGADDATAMTPLRTAQAIAAQASGIGINQTYQSVTRVSNTDYQNTLSRTITLVVTFSSRNGSVRVGPSTAAYLLVSGNTSSLSDDTNSRPVHTIPIPPGHYYRIGGVINNVKELR